MNETYLDRMSINNVNNKSKGSRIVNLDTIRGCKNNCESCFAKKNSCLSIKNFDVPVKVNKFTGKAKEDKFYRFGNFGDPATDWKHSEKAIKETKIKNNFVVTKLQNIDGFTGFIKNMQVSVDPLNKEHFFTTLKNVKTLLQAPKKPTIVLRIRSISTTDRNLNRLMKVAVDFANNYSLPVLETRIRFTKKEESAKKFNLRKKDYQYRSGYLRPNFAQSFLKDVNFHYMCDEKEVKCPGCENCVKLLNWQGPVWN